MDYGPSPSPCVKLVRERTALAVRGNHDQAVGYRVDCGCSHRFKDLSLATRQWMWQVLTEEEIAFLRQLPLEGQIELGGCKFYLTHAIPGDMHYYLEAGVSDDRLNQLTRNISADIIIWGHTHQPWIRQLGHKLIVNPGSLGQPRDGNPLSSYAIWEDGQIRLVRQGYCLEQTVKEIEQTSLASADKLRLVNILQKGA